MGVSETQIQARQLRRRLQRKYVAKRLMRHRRYALNHDSYLVQSLEPVGQPP
jgi:hypothetical protein